METLSHYERVSHDFADETKFSTSQVYKNADELLRLLETVEIPRQRNEINRLVGRAAFELGCRSLE